MAILFRTTSDFTIGGMTARLTVYSGSGRLRVEIEPYHSTTSASYTGALSVTVAYNGESETLSADPFTAPVSAVFAHRESVKSLTLSSADLISYNGVSSASCAISWKGDGTVPVPELKISYYSGLLSGQSSHIEWQADGVPEGYTAYTLGMWLCFASSNGLDPTYTRSTLVDAKTVDRAFTHTISGLEEKNQVFYRIAVGLYEAASAENAGREEYAAYAEIDSPVYVCSGDAIDTLAPCNLRYSGVQKNRAFTVTWDLLPTAIETGGFRIQYTYNGGTSWNTIYQGAIASNSYSFTVTQDWPGIAFRICSYSEQSKYRTSAYVYGKWVEIGVSNVYVGHNGNIVPAAAVQVGSKHADAVLHVG